MSNEVDELRRLLDAQPKPVCADLTPFTIVDARFNVGFVKIEFAAQPAFRNHFGNIQGGFAVAMLDAVVSIAAYALLRQWLPTIEMKSSFLEPIPIIAFIEGTLMTPDHRPAVTATATALVPAPRA